MYKPKPRKPVLLASAFKQFYSLSGIAECVSKQIYGLEGIARVAFRNVRNLRGIARSTLSRTRNLKRIAVVASISVLFASVYLCYGGTSTAYAATNANDSTVNFQARLMTASGAIVPDGCYNVEFNLYTASSGGSAIWSEAFTNQNSVSGINGTCYSTNGTDMVNVVNGYLTVPLGSLSAFSGYSINWNQPLYLTLDIGGTNSTGAITYDGEMAPRLQLTAVPYAFTAGELSDYDSSGYSSTLTLPLPTVGNETFSIPDQGAAGAYTLLTTTAANGDYIQNTTSPQASSNFNISGTGIANTSLLTPDLDGLTSGAILSIGGSNAATIAIGNSSLSTGTQTIDIGTNMISGGTTNVTIGSTESSSTTTLQGGSTTETLSSSGDTIQNTATSADTVTVDANALTTGTGLDVSADGLTTGNAVNVSTTSAAQSAAGSLLNVSDTATLTTNDGSTSGNLINASRSLTTDVSGGGGTNTPTLDNKAVLVNTSFYGTSESFSYTVNSGHSDYYLLVGASDYGDCTESNVTATYNGLTMTEIANEPDGGGNCYYLFGLASATSSGFAGSNSLTLTEVGGGGYAAFYVTASDWYDVNQTTPYSHFAYNYYSGSGSGTSPNLSYAWPSGHVAVDNMNMVDNGGCTEAPGSGQTLLADACDEIFGAGNGYYDAGTSSEPTTGSPLSMTWTNGDDYWSDGAVDLEGSSSDSASVTGPVASFSSNCTQTAGTCTDSSNVLQLQQQFSGATGAVLDIQNSGSGDGLFISNVNSAEPGNFLQLTTGATTEFQVANSGAITANGTLNIAGLVTASGGIQIGAGTSLIPILLELNKSSCSGACSTSDNDGNGLDPTTEVDGGMYYNTEDESFRCGEDGVWVACDGLVYSSTSTSGLINGQPDLTELPNTSYIIPYNDCQPGVVYQIEASGYLATKEAVAVQLYLEEGNGSLTSAEQAVAGGTAPGDGDEHPWVADISITCITTTSVEISGTFKFEDTTCYFVEPNGDTFTGPVSTWNNDSDWDALTLAVQWGGALGGSDLGLQVNQYVVTREGP